MFNRIDLDTHGCSHVGKVRKENEDHFLIAELHKSALIKSTNLSLESQRALRGSTEGILFMVADGVGGNTGGKEASEVALRTILYYASHSMRSFYKSDLQLADDLFRELALSIHLSHEAVIKRGLENPEHANMATTLTKVHVLWPHAYVVQIGDSRCYLLRDQKIEQLTKDQTIAEYLVDIGELKLEEARASQWGNALTQAIGTLKGTLKPSISKVNLREGDMLLLCSDGLTRHLQDEDIAKLAYASPTAKGACEALIDATLAAGGEDNVTVVLSKFN